MLPHVAAAATAAAATAAAAAATAAAHFVNFCPSAGGGGNRAASSAGRRRLVTRARARTHSRLLSSASSIDHTMPRRAALRAAASFYAPSLFHDRGFMAARATRACADVDFRPSLLRRICGLSKICCLTKNVFSLTKKAHQIAHSIKNIDLTFISIGLIEASSFWLYSRFFSARIFSFKLDCLSPYFINVLFVKLKRYAAAIARAKICVLASGGEKTLCVDVDRARRV